MYLQFMYKKTMYLHSALQKFSKGQYQHKSLSYFDVNELKWLTTINIEDQQFWLQNNGYI